MRGMSFSGSFYPSSRAKLIEFISNSLKNTPNKAQYKSIIGLIVPHAGYKYSGLTAVSAYNNLGSNHKKFILIGPCHECLYGSAYLDDDDYWATPLGDVKVDTDTVKRLSQYDIFKVSNGQHIAEHSIEVQLPLLHYFVKNDFSIVPIILADQSKATVADIAKILKDYIDGAILIISSDFNHYESSSVTHKKDMDLIGRIIALDLDGFYDIIEKENISACGYGGIAILMLITKLLSGRIELIRHDDSTTGGSSDKFVVGYASMIAFK
ncbi:MAG: AmmeMemoRadiSam system protein B [Candidatus Parvarchaeota archaeon]|nr:AmmeMemoRadiSam system protein B [Candidatus Parvarchaeota archaeon]MCW1301913.1 AmmeMemoRadiSam system protein B [Candidatus Parvarchaeota archaeon]